VAGLIHKFVGHQFAKNWLLDRAKNDDLPHALILQGPAGVGKRTLAQALLQVMNCPTEELACGECSFCQRALEDHNEFVYNLKPEGKKQIGVDQVREVHQFLSLKSLRQARFVIIDPADRMTASAANSLLKVLEEAPEKTYFFLITEQVKTLLPTIRSRAQILTFAPLSKKDLMRYRKFDEVSLAWSDGRLGLAIELSEQNALDQLNNSIQFFYSLLTEQPQDWKKKAPWFFGDDLARDFNFKIWHQALSKRLHNTEADLEWLPAESGRLSFIFEQVEDLKLDIDANVDKLLALENFYYKLHQDQP
jgi:DNA polymerase III delta' subunit